MTYTTLPPMCRGRWDGIRRPGPGYHQTIANREGYRVALVRWAADLINGEPDVVRPDRADFGLSIDQAVSVEGQLAAVLNRRADKGARFSA